MSDCTRCGKTCKGVMCAECWSVHDSACDRLRAAEQPPTPPSGRGEERERIEEIRKRWKRADGFRVVDSGELFTFVDDLLAAVDSRDAEIAGLVKAADLAWDWIAERTDQPPIVGTDLEVSGSAVVDKLREALAAARPFTKEPR